MKKLRSSGAVSVATPMQHLVFLSLRYTGYVFLLWFAFLSVAVYAKDDGPPKVSYDGLELVAQKKSGLIYRKPDIDVKKYNKLILLPCQVAFKKNWKRDYHRDHSTRITDRDMERIKREVAALFDEVFNEELSQLKRFTLTTEASEEAIVLRPAIINLDAYAPDVMTASRSRTYASQAGEGTLYIELFDSVSGQILARALDRRATRDRGYFQWANRVTNRADAKALMKTWAKKLHKKLDEVES